MDKRQEAVQNTNNVNGLIASAQPQKKTGYKITQGVLAVVREEQKREEQKKHLKSEELHKVLKPKNNINNKQVRKKIN